MTNAIVPASKRKRTPRASNTSKQQLLQAAIRHVQKYGIADLTLRQLATALNTSHPVLTYHFGSKEGLFFEIVCAIEEDQRKALEVFSNDLEASPIERLRKLWARVTEPALFPSARLFFEVYAHALQGRPYSTAFVDRIIEAQLAPLAQLSIEAGEIAKNARLSGGLILATIRGLYLDLLASGDRRRVDAAFELFVNWFEAHLQEVRPAGNRRAKR